MVHWHAVEIHETQRPLNLAKMKKSVLALKEGRLLFEQSEALVA